jgi:hypothetical protein
MVRLEGDMSLKNPVTPPGIDPGIVRLVAQRLNHYTTPGPEVYSEDQKFFDFVSNCAIILNFFFLFYVILFYRVAQEKPARRLVDQRGRRSRTLYRKLNKCKVLTG